MIEVGKVYGSRNSGDFVVLHYDNWSSVTIKFIDTGTVRVIRADHVLDGGVKDLNLPSVFGVGYFGVGCHLAKINKKYTIEYNAWSGMLRRCYDEKTQEAQPSYIGCTVCVEWHNFQNFAKWFILNKPDSERELNLDKDIKVHGNKIYSPSTCTIVTSVDNSLEARGCLGKTRLIKNSKGEVFSVGNMSQFARDNGLVNKRLSDLFLGKIKSHYGYSLVV